MQITWKDKLLKLIADAGISVLEAERRCGLANGTLRKLITTEGQEPTNKTLTAIAKGFGVPASWLLDTASMELPSAGSAVANDARNHGPGSAPPFPYRDLMANDIPVRGTAAGSHLRGAFQLTTDIIDVVRRPPGLVGARDIYALYIEGESMVPQYWPADLVFVSPHKPVRVGDAVIVQTSYNEGEFEGTIGIYRRRDEESVTIGKHNPAAEIKIKRGNHTLVHKVLTNNELFGI